MRDSPGCALAHMPIKKFTNGEATSADLYRLNLAYSKALRLLHLVDRNDPLTESLAKKVVEIGASGLTDPQEIAEAAAKHFRELR
jgi:hypothetical protein